MEPGSSASSLAVGLGLVVPPVGLAVGVAAVVPPVGLAVGVADVVGLEVGVADVVGLKVGAAEVVGAWRRGALLGRGLVGVGSAGGSSGSL